MAMSSSAGEARKGRNMYKTILVTLDGTPSDQAIIKHVKQLAKLAQSGWCCSTWPRRLGRATYGPDAVSREITDDTA